MDILGTLSGLVQESGFAGFLAAGGWKNLIMIAVACVLLYLGIGKKFEPLLMVGIAFGVLLTNIPGGGLYHMGMWDSYVYEAPYDVMYDYALYNKAETRAYTQEEFTYYVYARACGHSEAEIEAYFEDHKASGSDIYTDVMNLMASPDFDQSLVERLQADEKGETEWEVKNELSFTDIIHLGGLLDILYIGVKAGIYPCLIFIGIGAMTDFGPLISRPSSLILGAAAQLGVFLAFFGAVAMGFTGPEAGSIGIIGGADGPTAILTTSKLAPHLLGPIAIAAYSYMALIPLIQPPIMRALTTKKEREVKMEQTRPVSKVEKIVFPILVATFIILLIPSTAPLIGCLMFGNLLRETGCTDRLSDTAQNALMNIVTLFLGISVGATTVASRFLNLQTLMIIALGLIAFSLSTVGGLLVGKLMYVVTGGKVNPLIGSAGVSAVPMAARVAQVEGQKANPSNFLLMHAMGPNVAGVIGSAIAAGFLLKIFGA
ncbi:MAG: sodium ion-translocating decarboxylase subunit beta [Oscillospiraceae bacterium]|jgi:oxaloacetate decarboxylase beta subunit